MKKIFLILLAAVLLPMVLSAQQAIFTKEGVRSGERPDSQKAREVYGP